MSIMNAMNAILAWTPFLHPMPGVQANWLWLLPVLILGIAMMYKAIRVERLERWPREVAMMVGQVVLAFIGFAIGLYLLVQVLVPTLPAG